MVIDAANFSNVAIGKNATSSTPYSPAYNASNGNDMDFNFDQSAGNIFHSACDGTGWWQLDLGGVYDIHRVIVVNRYFSGDTFYSRLSGAVVELRNWYGDVIGSTTLSTLAVQTLTIATYPPSPTRTPTASATNSLTASSTPTSSSSATSSFGTTPTASFTATGTATQTPTPLSVLPYRVRLRVAV